MSFQDYPPPQNQGQWGAPRQETSGKSIAALVLGICGLFVCPLICSILAIVFAKQAYNEIDYGGGRYTGRDNAKAGLILGWVGLGIWGLIVVVYIGFIVLAIAFSAAEGDFSAIRPA